MELRHIRYFVALAETLSFTRAAWQMHVSQPTLSHQIRRLEEELGKALVTRRNRRVALTAEGEAFLSHAVAVLSEIDSALVDISTPRRKSAGHVHVGALSTLSVSVVPDSLAILFEANPGVSVRIEEISSVKEIERRLIEETLDIGLVYPPLSGHGLVVETLYEEQAVLFVRKDHKLARRRKIRLLDLHRQGVILPLGSEYRQLLEGLLRSVGAQPEVVVELVGFGTVPRLVEKTGLAAIVAENAVTTGEAFRAIPIERPLPVRVPSMCFKRERIQSPAVTALTGAIRQLAMQRRRRK
jgi:LysR family cyn operon transcriptional activator